MRKLLNRLQGLFRRRTARCDAVALDNWRLWAFQSEVGLQCKLARIAFHDLQDAVEAYSATQQALASERGAKAHPTAGIRESLAVMSQRNQARHRIWYSIHSLLTAAGNVSKLLWPGKPWPGESSGRARARQLRMSLGVDGPSPLKRRILRDHLEHIDRRLDRWALSPDHRSLVDGWVAPPKLVGVDRQDIFRHFDADSFVVSFARDDVGILSLVDALKRVQKKAEKVIHSRPWPMAEAPTEKA